MTERLTPLQRLLDGPMAEGRVVWIGLRAARREAVVPVEAAELVAQRGIEGDHYRTERDGARQVTLIAREHLAAVAGFLGRGDIDPALVRRNIMIEGLNLLALKDRRFQIGAATLEWSGTCDPCGRMEEALGAGGYNAMRNHGGITARVRISGRVQVGDPVRRLLATDPAWG